MIAAPAAAPVWRHPVTAAPLATYLTDDAVAVERILAATQRTYEQWSRLNPVQRVAPFLRLAELLRLEMHELAPMISGEMGKTRHEAEEELAQCARICDHYAAVGPALLKDEEVQTRAGRHLVARCPIGPILAVLPWSFPFWQVFRTAIPNLAAGNTVVVKPAPNVPRCSLALEDLFVRAGMPVGALSMVHVEPGRVERLVADPRIRGVSVTAGVVAGRAVAEAAGRHLKKVVLELGGSDPWLIMEDADLDQVAADIVKARLRNNGQCCIGPKRVIVARAVKDALAERLVERLTKLKFGDPLAAGVDLGPMARFDLRDRAHEVVQEAVAKGAKVHCGGYVPELPGAFYPATLVSGVRPGMKLFDDEIFGPIVVLCAHDGWQEAVALANRSDFALGAAIYTQDEERAKKTLLTEISCGVAAINSIPRSDMSLPFGGTKHSGFGRELGSAGLTEFTCPVTLRIGA